MSDSGFSNVVNDATLFIAGRKQGRRHLVAQVNGDQLRVLRTDGVVYAEFDILEEVMRRPRQAAWDVRQRIGDRSFRVRVVAERGCGCGGMTRYEPNADYSGVLRNDKTTLELIPAQEEN